MVGGATDAFVLQGIGLALGGRRILDDISLSFPKGQVTALLGHNGSGKSTLMMVMARQLRADRGRVLYDGTDPDCLCPRAFARQVAWLPQDPGAATEMTVHEIVASGRYPWHGPLGLFGDTDRAKVRAALQAAQLEKLADRPLATLSGGERQRAWLGMLIAQDSRCLLLDEPTAALDIAHQIEVLSLIRRLSHEHGRAVVIVMHDVNMAARFCDGVHALKAGSVVASGAPAEILRPDVLGRIYGVDMDVVHRPGQDLPLAYVR